MASTLLSLKIALLLCTIIINNATPSISFQSSSPSTTPSPPPLPAGFAAPLIHRDSIDSPLYNPKATAADLTESARIRATARKGYINRLIASELGPNKDTEIPLEFDRSGNYVIRYQIGTPPIETFGVFDTGSTLIWLQCEPCIRCYDQGEAPLYNPQKSSTWSQVQCTDAPCILSYDEHTSCGFPGPNGKTNCLYIVLYKDKSYSAGLVGTETISLQNSTLPGVVFGCGQQNNDTVGKGVHTPGIVGASRGASSIVDQLGAGRFSFCISRSAFRSSVKFGSLAVISEIPSLRTQLHLTDYLYYAALEDMSVDGDRLNLGVSMKSDFNYTTADGLGPVLIDSGTDYTSLPTKVFDKVKNAVVEYMTGRGYNASYLAGEYELCYGDDWDDYTHVPDEVPEISFHFEGGMEFPLSKRNTWEKGCFALERDYNGYATLGLNQLYSVEVGFDLRNEILSLQYTWCR